MSSEEAFVSIRGMSFTRGDRLIFNELDLDIPRGKVTAIMGPSGTGKTTLLRLIGGQLMPDIGTIEVDGHNVPSLKRAELFELRKQTMGMLFQSGALFTDLSVFENVAFPIRVHTDLPESMIRDLVLMKLEAVGLRGARHLMPAELSGGMARRVALARTIALDPEMMLYDEPFTGLDPISLSVTVKLIKSLNDSLGLTSVLVTHDIDEACSIADYVCLLSEGKVIAFDSPQNLMKNGSEQVLQFMQGKPDGPVPFHFPADDFSADLFKQVKYYGETD
jgi:phospholipid/cholesterol/gamma-HCH transport system ATP-binding protein